MFPASQSRSSRGGVLRLRRDDGVTMVEYGILVAVFGIALIGVASFLLGGLRSAFLVAAGDVSALPESEVVVAAESTSTAPSATESTSTAPSATESTSTAPSATESTSTAPSPTAPTTIAPLTAKATVKKGNTVTVNLPAPGWPTLKDLKVTKVVEDGAGTAPPPEDTKVSYKSENSDASKTVTMTVTFTYVEGDTIMTGTAVITITVTAN